MTLAAPVYLDHAATTAPAPEVVEAVARCLRTVPGNPSSLHAAGRAARAAVDEAREQVAAALGCAPRELVFTSGGSEADNLAVRGVAGRRGGHLVVTAIEHDAVLKTAERLAESGVVELSVVGCDSRARVDPEEVAAAVRDDTTLVSVMLANNEVGTLQDVAGVTERVRRRNPRTLVHTDAVQALGKVELDAAALGVDLLTVSAHKVHGPKGVGALFVRQGTVLDAQIIGGGHERGRRSGTENVAGIAGFGVAAQLVTRQRARQMPRLERLRDRLERQVRAALPDVVVAASGAPRLPTFAAFALPHLETELVLTLLDQLGVEASGGSACSSGARMPSHVLVAMGLPPHLCAGALRCTLGLPTTEAEVERAASAIVGAVGQLRARLGASAG